MFVGRGREGGGWEGVFEYMRGVICQQIIDRRTFNFRCRSTDRDCSVGHHDVIDAS